MKTEIREVDSKLAVTWLNQSDDNRPLRKSHVTYLAKEMEKGRWRLTHQGIAFDSDGALMDGQHRLQAIQESNITIPLQVSYYDKNDNLDFAFPILDRGLVRSVADITRIDNKIIQIYNVLFSLGTKKGRIPPDEYIILDAVFGTTVRQFLVSCPYMRTYFTPAVVRAAGLSSLYLHKSPIGHISQIFKAWGTGDTRNTPPIVSAFMNYLPSVRANGRIETNKVFTAAFYALLEKNVNKSRLNIRDERISNTIQEIRLMVDDAMKKEIDKEPEVVKAQRQEIRKLNEKLMKKTSLDIQAEQSRLSMGASGLTK